MIGETAVEVIEQNKKPLEGILSFFPLETPRNTQGKVIVEIDKAFKQGKRIVILEAPVGSGKSAIAMTFARAFKDSHVITPRKSLQDQYYEDFPEDIVLMKGRNAYPCTIEATPMQYVAVCNKIAKGHIATPTRDSENCGSGPCRNSKKIYQFCTSNHGPCPYNIAIETAQQHHTVVHNIHSFIFQTNFGEKFEKRELMIIDEAHEIENTIRGFITKKFSVPLVIAPVDLPNFETVDGWCDFFLQDSFLPVETAADVAKKAADETYESERDSYILRVEDLRGNSEYYQKDFSVKPGKVYSGARETGTSFEFIPHSIGNAAHRYMFDYGDKVLLMSGTIYDHDQYCRSIGVNPSEALSIRIPSSFPVANRPIYLKPEYQTDTSFVNWKNNFSEMVKIIDRIQNIFKDAKGLIHAPSYEAAGEIASFVPGNRLMTHGRHDFQEKLEEFYASKQPLIFVSPVCQQGVDFKDDRARFQILTRVPYLNTSDEFVAYKVQNDFNWYNYQALIVFGQMLGRPVRSEKDFGATFLLDSRFNKFISKNSKKLPKWVQDAYVWR